jgi:hypothetical protein
MKWPPFEPGNAVLQLIRNSPLKRTCSSDLKDFAAQLPDHHRINFQKLGTMSVPVEKVVGSVGRAQDLDQNFRYRGRAITERYQQAAIKMKAGQPCPPIKLFQLKRPRTSTEYYVFDGHHRLAAALQQGYHDVNAVVTGVQIHDVEN